MVHPANLEASQGAWVELAYDVYVPLVCIFGAALYFGRIRRLPMLNQLLALTTCAVWLPPFSVDYTLLQLLLPLGLLCVFAAETWRKGVQTPGLRGCFLCFAFLYPVGSFFLLRYRFGSMVRCFALGALLIVVLRFPFAWPEFDREEAA
jgi:hypothetical protein